ncbi:ABC transporter ATP-binding protein [Microlunatus flavus]|uniref:Putative ABC transport system ATP-binding protein n=1 Tax=Microlunatus flavus TaxID=1036181 RepID=A0A1H9FPL1_9ACTN|nr:ABC transporter ATP-binding protein [Microlunatus flavus]SEQ39891.1 putative ABC transport system ATP-binding protein [Microlunatus flavus]
MAEPLLSGLNLRKAYERTAALDAASLRLAAGEIVAVTGRSGSGKSTLMLCLSGVLRPDSGEVVFDGVRVDRLSEAERSRLRRQEFGLVLQFGQLLPELSVGDNVALPLLLDARPRRDARAAARTWIERFGVDHLEGARPGELSGGEAQRVALARALVSGPRVVFADEPTGALDTVGAQQVLELVVDTVRREGTSVVLVTHDNTVAAFADREVVLADGRTQADDAGPGAR